MIVLETQGNVSANRRWTGQLYREIEPSQQAQLPVRLVPYFAWGNRGNPEMSVWLPLSNR